MSTILVVDDKKDMRDSVQKHLVDSGYRILTAASAEAALEVLGREKAEVVVTDMKMPGMNGLELLEKIKEKDAEVQVIVMTAFGTVEDAVTAMRGGAYDFVLKPFSMEGLELKIKNCLQVGSLKGENLRLKDELSQFQGKMVGESPAMKQVYDNIRRLSAAKTTILIEGESGTGKELAAQAIHESGPWKDAPFIRVHCAALAPNLLESEIFGHEKGAFTGAVQRKQGRFELAQGGTLFLDEISEVAPEIQVKLLRVLQEREFERVGGTQTLKVDLRVITATNKNLKELVEKGVFREDLYYRLNVVSLRMPPLRERPDDIPLLCESFLDRFCRQMGKPSRRLSDMSLKALKGYAWPGNVRELQNLMERAVVFSEKEELDVVPEGNPNDVKAQPALQGDLSQTLDQLEKALILQALQETHGVQNQAAKQLGVSRSALQYKIAKYQLEEYCREKP
jgi:DNA-binding NtrC family response regulator